MSISLPCHTRQGIWFLSRWAGLLACGVRGCGLPGFPQWHVTNPNRIQSRGRLWHKAPDWVTRTKFPIIPVPALLTWAPNVPLRDLMRAIRQDNLRQPPERNRWECKEITLIVDPQTTMQPMVLPVENLMLTIDGDDSFWVNFNGLCTYFCTFGIGGAVW